MFARMMFLGLMIVIVTLPIGILATGAAGFLFAGTGSLTLASMVGGTVTRAFRIMR